MRHSGLISSLVVLGCLGFVAGCGSNPAGQRPGATSDNGNAATTTASTTAGTGGAGGVDTTSTTGASTTGALVEDDPGVPTPPDACTESVAGQRLLRRLTVKELLNTHDATFPATVGQVTSTLQPDLQGPVRMTNDAGTLIMGSQMAEAILARAEEIATLVTTEPNLSTRLPCAAQADAACATQFINTNGAALFRRPLSDTERARYEALFSSVSGRSDFATGLKWTLVALIQSPYSVYRSELGEGGQLTPYELASELSYNYSARPPTPELMALAESGGLSDSETRVAEAQKLLASSGGQEVVQQFFSEWLWLSQVGSVNRANAPENFPTIRAKMLLETQRFINEVVYTNRGTISDLLTADYTVLDSDLSAFYGVNGGTGDLYAGGGVSVPRDQGIGIFAQGSVLTANAMLEITSPTRRGLLILKRLLCQVPGVPEALNFDLTNDVLVSGNTTRERMEASHLQAPCQACHVNFDPFGFAFENFDNMGRYRTEEVTPNGSFPINSTVDVAQLDGQTVTGQEELMNAVEQSPEMLSCVSATLERYIYGSSGECRAKDARAQVMAGQVSILDFLAALAREPHFTSRM